MLPRRDNTELFNEGLELLRQKQPFLAAVADGLEVQEHETLSTPLAASGKAWYIGKDQNELWSAADFAFAIGSLALSLVWEHQQRRGDRDVRTWNYASNLLTNDYLHKEGIASPGDGMLLDPRFSSDTHTIEEVYDAVREEHSHGACSFWRDGEFERTEPGESIDMADLIRGALVDSGKAAPELPSAEELEKNEAEHKERSREIDLLRQRDDLAEFVIGE